MRSPAQPTSQFYTTIEDFPTNASVRVRRIQAFYEAVATYFYQADDDRAEWHWRVARNR